MNEFEFVHAERAHHEVQELCENLEVSRSGYYAWASRSASQHERDDERLQTKIRAIHAKSRQNYGSPRVHAALRAEGERTSRKRVARLMRENGLRGLQRRRFRRTTDSRHRLPVAENLVAQNFRTAKPNQLWVGDITYIWTTEGWAYLAVVIDACHAKSSAGRCVQVSAESLRWPPSTRLSCCAGLRRNSCITPTVAANTRATSTVDVSRSTGLFRA